MLRGLVALALGVALVGCGGSSASPDATVVADDLPAVSGDLAVPQSCAQVYACTTGCSTPACTGQCAAAGTSGAQERFAALYECAYAHCLPSGTVADAGVDGGAGSCTSTTDDSALCHDCLHDEELSPACSTQLSSCVSS